MSSPVQGIGGPVTDAGGRMTIYRCPKCGATYPHDAAYKHAAFECPNIGKRGGLHNV